MPPKKRKARQRGQVQTAAAQAKARDQETIRQINQALENGQDIQQLRKLAAVRGLVNTELRARLWPCLLAGMQASQGPACSPLVGASPRTSLSGGAPDKGDSNGMPHAAGDNGATTCDELAEDQYKEWAAGEHKDTTTVRVDVERSLHSFAGFLTDPERAARRRELTRLLNAVVIKHEGSVYYYQGLHDVASVLLLVAGECPAFDMLCRLATGHLRDATRPSLDPVIELLGLMGPIVEAADPELASLLHKQGLPPFYALSWFITWFSHDLADFAEVCRLFDLFLATHPLMPLYVGAVAMHSQRQQLLAADEMPVLHSKLVNLHITQRATADQLAVQAIELYKRAQPASLVSSQQLLLQQCIAPRVHLRLGVWHYPEAKTTGPSLWSQQRLQGLVQQMIRLPLPGSASQRKKLMVATVSGVLGSLYVVAMCVLVAKNVGHSSGAASPFSLLYKL